MLMTVRPALPRAGSPQVFSSEGLFVRTKIILLPLFASLQVATDGTDVAVYLDIDNPDFKHLLAIAVGITLHSLTFGAPGSNEFEWNVVFLSGYNRANETADINKIGPSANISTNGAARVQRVRRLLPTPPR